MSYGDNEKYYDQLVEQFGGQEVDTVPRTIASLFGENRQAVRDMYDEVKQRIAESISWKVQEMIDDLGTETETDEPTDQPTDNPTDPDTDPEAHAQVKEVIADLGDDWSEHADYTESISRHIAGRMLKLDQAALASLIGDVAYNTDPEEVHGEVCRALKALDWAELKNAGAGHVVEQVTAALRAMRE